MAERKAVAFQAKLKSYKMLSSDEDDVVYEKASSQKKGKFE